MNALRRTVPRSWIFGKIPLNFHLIYFLNTTQQETYRGRNHDLDGFKMPAVSDNIDEVSTTDQHDMFVPHEMFELRTRKRDLKGKRRVATNP